MIPALIAGIAILAAIILTLVYLDTPTKRERERTGQ
jgi:capsular polysaccharide biosynthesis protein